MKLTIIGAGNMGSAIARGFIKSKKVLAAEVTLSNPSDRKLLKLKEEFPEINITKSNIDATKGADIIILAVKPWIIRDVITEISPLINSENIILISVAAGITTKDLKDMLGNPKSSLPIYSVIPNTAASKGASMTFITSLDTTIALDNTVTDLFSGIGEVMMVAEKNLPAYMSLSSCGIAYAMRYVRAAMEGGIELGIPAPLAQKVVLQTMLGAVELLRDGAHPETEIDKVTTPGGITIKGLNTMEKYGFTTSVIEGLKASVK